MCLQEHVAILYEELTQVNLKKKIVIVKTIWQTLHRNIEKGNTLVHTHEKILNIISHQKNTN